MDIKISVNRKYLATCEMDGYVLIWRWQSFRPIIKCLDVAECLVAFHPWKEDDLIIGKCKI